MAHTISTHVGHTVSRDHNLRDENAIKRQDHIDRSGHFEIWADRSEWRAYRELFGKAQADYNRQQSRPDRQIPDYHAKIAKDAKKHTVYEMIVSVGSRDNPIPSPVGYDIMREFTDNWRKRNPHLELIGAYYHADEEGVPHVHLDFIPWADGYKKGLSKQTSLRKALEQQGFVGTSPKETSQILWERSENDHLEQLCRQRGIEIEHPQRDKGAEHAHTAAYKAQKDAEQAKREEMHAKRVSRLYEPFADKFDDFVNNLSAKRLPLIHEIEQQRKETGLGGKKTVLPTELVDRALQYMSKTYNITQQFKDERELITQSFAKWEKETFLQTPESDHRSVVNLFYDQAVEISRDADKRVKKANREISDLRSEIRSKDRQIEQLKDKESDYRDFLDQFSVRDSLGQKRSALQMFDIQFHSRSIRSRSDDMERGMG